MGIYDVDYGGFLGVYTQSCDEALHDLVMHQAMLISLVKNAIKHCLAKSTRAGHATISAKQEKTHILIAVVDDVVGLTDNVGRGVGLMNIHQFLAH
nr:hypothetical protein [uncultured Undibacterium sp.]